MKAPVTHTTRMWSSRERDWITRTVSYQPCEIEGCSEHGSYGFPFGSYCKAHRELGEDRLAAQPYQHHGASR